MTREEFDNTRWGAGAKCYVKASFNQELYDVVSVNFGEALIALDDCNDPDDPTWYRCESVGLV